MEELNLEVGVMLNSQISFVLDGEYFFEEKKYSEVYDVCINDGKIEFEGLLYDRLVFEPISYNENYFSLKDVSIGIDFHWERTETQCFKGTLILYVENKKIRVVNKLSLEDYLLSVISSEMKATSSIDLLKAHAIISRSWLMAQIVKSDSIKKNNIDYNATICGEKEISKWYDREDHIGFHVCADDHCQRYQGINRQSTQVVQQAINETKGVVLISEGEICDARFSKCCGGISETFNNVWENKNYTYLQSTIDSDEILDSYNTNLKNNENADLWIRNHPNTFCATKDSKILSQILNDYDQETEDFYRWEKKYSQKELSLLLKNKTGFDFGCIIDLIPLERGFSGRITRLKIIGSKQEKIIGKELYIRRALSDSHLYSSCFVIDRGFEVASNIPVSFTLLGAGWGHGVGLCQIGAAVMAEKKYSYKEILNHYFVDSSLEKKY